MTVWQPNSFLAHLALPKWVYIIVIHDFIIIWDHDFGFVGICVVCVCSSWPEYWSHKLHILQIYHIMPTIDEHQIFSWYHLYFSTGSHFAQILKMALLSLSLNLEAQYCTWSWIQSGATYSQGLHRLKVINVLKILHFPRNQVDFIMKSARFHMKSTWFHIKSAWFHEIHQIS